MRGDGVRLHGLVCNAGVASAAKASQRPGALANEKTMTSEGVEVTFAAHLLFGRSGGGRGLEQVTRPCFWENWACF